MVIRNSRVTGASDAGIYVGQSTNILVEDNETYGNVAGIEIENSTGATVRDNHVHDNTAEILIFNLPGLPVEILILLYLPFVEGETHAFAELSMWVPAESVTGTSS